MPEPKPSKRTFEAQSEPKVAGLRLVSQRAERTDGESGSATPETNPCPGEIPSPEPELVSKLIKFLKTF